MNDPLPSVRTDLELFPIMHNGQQLILIRDHLGLVQEGRAIALPLYQLMSLLDGTRTLRDLQLELMRHDRGGLVEKDEVQGLLDHLDGSFLLDSDRFRAAKDQIVTDFISKTVRPCLLKGSAYPENPSKLRIKMDEIMESQPPLPAPEGHVVALISPHIDLSAGFKTYSSAYQMLKYTAPKRIVVLGVGHQMIHHLFCVTETRFETPLGVIPSAPQLIKLLRENGEGNLVAADDFGHRSEHSIEFQTLFFQHMLAEGSFEMVPVLCGPVQPNLPEYTRDAYLDRAGPFLYKLRDLLSDPNEETLLVAGVDLSHIGPKFGHELTAERLQTGSEAHDKNLLRHLERLDADRFWEESRNVADQFNVCGFSALACLLEILPPCEGRLLDYRMWHEAPTRSAVSFSAMVFTS